MKSEKRGLHHANNINYMHHTIAPHCGTPLYCTVAGLALLKLKLSVVIVDRSHDTESGTDK